MLELGWIALLLGFRFLGFGGMEGSAVESTTWNVVMNLLVGCFVVFLPVQSGSPCLFPITPFQDQTLLFNFEL
jgi:hypothetical protein